MGENKVLTNPYKILGIVLATGGAILTPIFYFVVGSVPLAATGMSAIILGLTAIAIANARPYVSPETCQMLLKTGMENTAALLEELGIRNKAIYLPSTMRDGHAQAIIPLIDGNAKHFSEKLSGRLIVRYGPGSDEMGIAVTTPGSVNLEMLDNKPGATSGEIESALNYLLTGVLDIASGVTVEATDTRVQVEIRGARMSGDNIWYYQCLGSPLASIVAAVSSEALGKPVRIAEESFQKEKGHITIEVVS